MRFLTIAVRIHGGRFHGMRDRDTDEWPPSPARLFQALVAAAGRRGTLSEDDRAALRWLEQLEAPAIAAPRMQRGQRVALFVPDNDLDAVQGDPGRIAEIRSSKLCSPKLFDPEQPFLYIWDVGDAAPQATAICGIAQGVYQLGRGVDLAWADAHIDDGEAHARRLADYPGELYRPCGRGDGELLACPAAGSLASLEARHAAYRARFAGPSSMQQFLQPPKARFLQIPYDSPVARLVYELRRSDQSYAAQPVIEAAHIVEQVRDEAARRLAHALPDQAAAVERCVIGRKVDGADAMPASARVRIIPLPSIGHEHADHGIRRVLIEVPPICPLRASDVNWAFSGLELGSGDERTVTLLIPSSDDGMLAHYAVGTAARRWQTVTPAVLPESAMRRRIDPSRIADEAKPGSERAREEAGAAAAVRQALRHAGISARAEAIRVQREPFARNGERVEPFAAGTRFAKERLWHVEVGFATPVSGPMAIGDGRFLGLGVMAPATHVDGVFAFAVEAGLEHRPSPEGLARALRRAVMARVQTTLGARRKLPAFFTGHEDDGKPTKREHLTFAFDPRSTRLLVIAPHVVAQRRAFPMERELLETLQAALDGFSELRAGGAGRLQLRPILVDEAADPLLAASRVWTSLTSYRVNRHARDGAITALVADVLAECRRSGLPAPSVTTTNVRGIPGLGLVGDARMEFAVAVPGPIMLGKSRFLGGGLFLGQAPQSPG